MKTIRVRIAPSPTGDPHVGTAYVALMNFIFARHHQGQFILRIEDTDQKRSQREYEENIYKALSWCGLSWDEGPDRGGPYGPYRQSERTEIYRQFCQRLLDEGKAYKCFATAQELKEMREVLQSQGKKIGYDRRYRNLSEKEIRERESKGESYVVRLKVPLTGECVFQDGIRGRISFPWADIDDQILMKSDGFPTYHLANVVDDHLMKITHVIRGDEWVSSTPKHILLYEAFGVEPPTFIHLPLLLNTDGKKLSKRKNPTSIFYYRNCGYLPEALLNFLSLMGYSMADDQEIYDLPTVIASFDPKRFGKSGAIFDRKKLDWINQQYIIKQIPLQELWPRIEAAIFPREKMVALVELCSTRMKTFGDFIDLSSFFFINQLPYNDELFSIAGVEKERLAELLLLLLWEIEKRGSWSAEVIEESSKKIAELTSSNHKKVIMPLLFATIEGKKQGLPLYSSVAILGKNIARARFLEAISFLGGVSAKKEEKLKKLVEEAASAAG